jgi:hypothetical protein
MIGGLTWYWHPHEKLYLPLPSRYWCNPYFYCSYCILRCMESAISLWGTLGGIHASSTVWATCVAGTGGPSIIYNFLLFTYYNVPSRSQVNWSTLKQNYTVDHLCIEFNTSIIIISYICYIDIVKPSLHQRSEGVRFVHISYGPIAPIGTQWHVFYLPLSFKYIKHFL